MLTTLLNAIATIVLYNFFIPFLTIPLYASLLVLLGPKVRAARWLKLVAALLALPVLHALVVLGSLLFMILASRYTGVIYWAA
jgi:hypothetical protein